jgi:predicted DNA-binding transcriptional regulator AlpA
VPASPAPSCAARTALEIVMTGIVTSPHVRVREAANYVGLSKSTLDKLRMGSDGPTYLKVGRAVVYHVADLDTWLASKRRSSTWGANDNAPKGERLAA